MTREERENAIKVIKNYDLNFHKINGMLFKAEEIANAFECALEALEQEPILDKIRAEINEYGSLWVEYKIEGHSDKDTEKIVEKVLKQAKQQVLQIIDKYRK